MTFLICQKLKTVQIEKLSKIGFIDVLFLNRFQWQNELLTHTYYFKFLGYTKFIIILKGKKGDYDDDKDSYKARLSKENACSKES